MKQLKSSFFKSQFLALLLSVSFSNLITLLLSVSDSIIAGNIFGENAIAAVGIVAPINSLAMFIGGLIYEGSNILYSKSVGEANYKSMRNIFSEGLILSVIAGILFFFALLGMGDFYFASYRSAENVYIYIEEYFYFYKYVYAITPLFLYLSGMVLIDGDKRISSISFAVRFLGSVSISIILSSLLGIRGIGLGALISMCASIAVLCLHFISKKSTFRFCWHLRLSEIPTLLKYSVSESALYLYDWIIVTFMNSIVLSMFGEKYLCVGSMVRILNEFFFIFDGAANATGPFVSVFIGEKNTAGEKKILRMSLISAFFESIIFSIVFSVFAKSIVQLFGINDASLLPDCVTALRIVVIPVVGYAVLVVLVTYYNTSGRVILAAALGAIYGAIVPVVLGYILCHIIGLNGLWIAIGFAPGISVLLTMLYVFIRYGKDKVPFIMESFGNESFSFDIEPNEKSVIEFRNAVEELLKENSLLDEQNLNRVLLICEELPISLIENNDSRIKLECTVLIAEDVQLIFRDNGKIFNIIDSDMQITSLRSYLLSQLMTLTNERINMVTTSYNRNIITLSNTL